MSFRLSAILSIVLLLGTSLTGLSQTGTDSDSKAKTSSTQLIKCSFEHEHELQTLTGEFVSQIEGNELYLIDRMGRLHTISSDKIKRIEEIEGTLDVASPKEMGQYALSLMPAGSQFITTKHFVVCYNTSEVYARWNANLYENLYKAFYTFWKTKGIELTPPRFPLVALVFASRNDYINFASREFPGASSTLGYYHQSTNRLASFDLTGIEGKLPPGYQVNREDLLTELFSRPQAERTIATIIHEACHQISFNSSLQTRMGDNPRWLSEGIAMFFESPDFSSTSGWGGIGKVNRHNLDKLRGYSLTRNADSLELLLSDDKRMTQEDSMSACYAESWGVTFFLLKQKTPKFVEYLKEIRSRSPGTISSGSVRVQDFKKYFGNDLSKVDRDLVNYIRKLQ